MPIKSTAPAFANGDLVTVTIALSDGETQTFHGTVIEDLDMHTIQVDRSNQPHFTQVPLIKGKTEVTYGETRRFFRIYSATGNRFAAPSESGPDYAFSYHEFYATPSKSVKIRKITKAGRAWIQANLSLDMRRDALIEEARALDPKFADKMERVLEDVREQAFEEGKDYEWRSNDY